MKIRNTAHRIEKTAALLKILKSIIQIFAICMFLGILVVGLKACVPDFLKSVLN